MALLAKLRLSTGHRWMPFFLPVVGSLLYVLFAVLLIPDRLSSDGKSEDDEAATAPIAASASVKPADSAGRALRRSRTRALPRTPGSPAGVPAPGAAAPVPAPLPASPDGNE